MAPHTKHCKLCGEAAGELSPRLCGPYETEIPNSLCEYHQNQLLTSVMRTRPDETIISVTADDMTEWLARTVARLAKQKARNGFLSRCEMVNTSGKKYGQRCCEFATRVIDGNYLCGYHAGWMRYAVPARKWFDKKVTRTIDRLNELVSQL